MIQVSQTARSLGLDIYGYQRRAIEMGLDIPFFYYGLDMGLGKTVISLTLANTLKLKKVLVLCPAQLVTNWKKETLKWFDSSTVVMSINLLRFDSPRG